jgi:hypothetical protein
VRLNDERRGESMNERDDNHTLNCSEVRSVYIAVKSTRTMMRAIELFTIRHMKLRQKWRNEMNGKEKKQLEKV